MAGCLRSSSLLVAAYVWYAMIVTRRNRVSEALAGIDVQLQQRHDLIPNVLTIARRFMEHERTLLEEITELRNKAQAQVGSRDFAAAEQRFETEKRLGSWTWAACSRSPRTTPTLKSAGPDGGGPARLFGGGGEPLRRAPILQQRRRRAAEHRRDFSRQPLQGLGRRDGAAAVLRDGRDGARAGRSVSTYL